MGSDHLSNAALLTIPPVKLDYSLTGVSAREAVEKGLAEADWYQTPVPRDEMRPLLARTDARAIVDTLLWFGLLGVTGWLTVRYWGTGWAALPYAVYAVLYATASDSRWHECGHGTAFKTDWLNRVVYEIASFMVMRESVVWRWSHTRHHSDTIIVGRDPEIQVSRPPNIKAHLLSIFAIQGYLSYFPRVVRHATGRMDADEQTYTPATEFGKIYRNARVVLVVHALVILLSIYLQTLWPIFLIILPPIFGTWLMIVHNTTQHAGLAENVLDHRLNCRTVYMNPVSRFIYWNMNYHLEHHMFPLVPYHRLPRLHELIKHDCPPPYTSILQAWREIIPAVLKQVKDPAYHIKRRLPESKSPRVSRPDADDVKPDAEGWTEVCAGQDLGVASVIRYDFGRKTFAIYRDVEGQLYATDGICTHGNVHLSEGLVHGKTIECSKHNGRFNLLDGSPARAPVCRGLATYPIEERRGRLYINVLKPGGHGTRQAKSYAFKVMESRNISTFIREILLEPSGEMLQYQPGDYVQVEIPAYDQIRFSELGVAEPYLSVWKHQHVVDLVARNVGGSPRRNNYSLASNPKLEKLLRLNVRLATPPPGQDCSPGIGSAYMWSLRPGDTVTASGPFGNFHIKPTQKEMVYIGGGAGMAPLRSHLSYLLETAKSHRKISFWYGARSKQELFYIDYFEGLAREHPNFAFHAALSSPRPEDNWAGLAGFIHEVALERYLKGVLNLNAIEFYLCGPPMMVKASTTMLASLGARPEQVAFDEF